MKIRKGDQVLIIKGKDRGKKAKVLRGFPKEAKVLVEGVNIKKVHKRPRKEGEKGQVVEVAAPLPISKLKLICPKCGKPTRIGYTPRDILPTVEYKEKSKIKKDPTGRSRRLQQKLKIRVCKKCGQEI